MAARVFYTRYFRSHDNSDLWPASNAQATPPPEKENLIVVNKSFSESETDPRTKDETYIEEVSSNSSFESLTPKHTPKLSQTTSISQNTSPVQRPSS
jgi:hypothetical protein